MQGLLDKHTIKIQLTAALVMVGFIVYWTFIGAGYVKQVEAQGQEITEIKPKIEKIPVVEADIGRIKQDISEIKQDVKSLLKNR